MLQTSIDVVRALLIFLMAATPPSGELRGQVEQIAREAQGRVGAAVVVLETGETTALRGDEQFPMQSVYKLPISMAVLREVDGGKISLEQKVRVEQGDLIPTKGHSPVRDKHPRGVELSVRELLRYTMVESDGTTSDVLLRLVGGPERVNAYLRGLGVEGIVVADTEAQLARDGEAQYRNWATPAAAVALLRALHEGRGLSAESRALLLQFMNETGTGPRRLKGLLPAGTAVAHKTGSSGTFGGVTRATNDIGIITLPDGRHLAVAVFVADSTADTNAREGVIAKIARAAWDLNTKRTSEPPREGRKTRGTT